MERKNYSSIFVFLLLLSIALYLLGRTGSLSFLEKGLQPIQKSTFAVFGFFGNLEQNEEIEKLKKENLELSKRLLDQKKLDADLMAFRDQFETETIRSSILIPAEILGIKGFIPNITPPEYYVLDKGKNDNVKEGDAVVFEDNFVGKIDRVSVFRSRVLLPTNSSFSFSAKVVGSLPAGRQVLGVVKGQGGGEMILDNVLLSEKINTGDFVMTSPDADLDGRGIAGNLIVGKIVSIEKGGELFQKARIKSLIDYSKVTRVFILIEAR